MLIASAIFFSCNSGSDLEEKEKMIHGDWVYHTMSVNGSDILENMDFAIQMEFKEDSTFTRVMGEVEETGTWILLNDSTIQIQRDYAEEPAQDLHIELLTEESLSYSIQSEDIETIVVLLREETE